MKELAIVRTPTTVERTTTDVGENVGLPPPRQPTSHLQEPKPFVPTGFHIQTASLVPDYMTCKGQTTVLPRNPTNEIGTLFLDPTPTHHNVLLTPTPKTASQAQSGNPLGPVCHSRYPASGETPSQVACALCYV